MTKGEELFPRDWITFSLSRKADNMQLSPHFDFLYVCLEYARDFSISGHVDLHTRSSLEPRCSNYYGVLNKMDVGSTNSIEQPKSWFTPPLSFFQHHFLIFFRSKGHRSWEHRQLAGVAALFGEKIVLCQIFFSMWASFGLFSSASHHCSKLPQ